MMAIFCVGIGGFLGAVGRYLLGLVPFEGDFPLMTFLINFMGAVVIGGITEIARTSSVLPPEAVLFLKTGICGGFTTFSTFSLETVTLFEEGKYAIGSLYAGGSLVACVGGVVAGRILARGVSSLLQQFGIQGG